MSADGLTNTPATVEQSTHTRPVAQEENANELIALTIGERNFTTWKRTLTDESPFFANTFKDDWRQRMTRPDGSIFVDRDGDMFEHILAYLRSSSFPFFYTSNEGFDVALYHKLWVEAEYFMIDVLSSWIEQELYKKCVQTRVCRLDMTDLALDRKTALNESNALPNWLSSAAPQITPWRTSPRSMPKRASSASSWSTSETVDYMRAFHTGSSKLMRSTASSRAKAKTSARADKGRAPSPFPSPEREPEVLVTVIQQTTEVDHGFLTGGESTLASQFSEDDSDFAFNRPFGQASSDNSDAVADGRSGDDR